MDLSNIPNPQDFALSAQSEQDQKLLVKLFVESVPDAKATAALGRPQDKEVLYIQIHAPGARDGVVSPVNARHRQRFPRHFEAYEARQEAPIEGTMLKNWPQVSTGQVANLAYMNIKTVEQLAAVPDSSDVKFMGFANLKRLAQLFVEASKGGAPLSRMVAELDERDVRIAHQDAQIEGLTARLAALETQAAAPGAAAPAPARDASRADESTLMNNPYASALDADPVVEPADMQDLAEELTPPRKGRRRAAA